MRTTCVRERCATQGPGYRTQDSPRRAPGWACCRPARADLAGTYGLDDPQRGFGIDPSQVLTFKMDVSPARFVARERDALLLHASRSRRCPARYCVRRWNQSSAGLRSRRQRSGACGRCPSSAPEALPSLGLDVSQRRLPADDAGPCPARTRTRDHGLQRRSTRRAGERGCRQTAVATRAMPSDVARR